MVLMVAAPARGQTAAAVLDAYREKTSVVVRCARRGSNEILVCGRRAADKWRVPFLGLEPGDPQGRTVSEERNRLASEPPVKCGIAAFLHNCGMVGAKLSTRFGGSGPQLRRLAD